MHFIHSFVVCKCTYSFSLDIKLCFSRDRWEGMFYLVHRVRVFMFRLSLCLQGVFCYAKPAFYSVSVRHFIVDLLESLFKGVR